MVRDLLFALVSYSSKGVLILFQLDGEGSLDPQFANYTIIVLILVQLDGKGSQNEDIMQDVSCLS